MTKKQKISPSLREKQRQKNIALLIVLVCLSLLFYGLSIVRFKVS